MLLWFQLKYDSTDSKLIIMRLWMSELKLILGIYETWVRGPFLEIPKSFRTRKAVEKSETFF